MVQVFLCINSREENSGKENLLLLLLLPLVFADCAAGCLRKIRPTPITTKQRFKQTVRAHIRTHTNNTTEINQVNNKK